MSKDKHIYDDYFHILSPALSSKAEEFEILGYDRVSEEDIWHFLKQKRWKNPKEGIRIYELFSDIMSVKPGDYMNYATVEAFRSPDLLKDLDNEDLQQLLGDKES
ncbi:post-transcriptional regulator [Siminovitchia sp. FSL H7-0308]|uniref:post-transcriptional regulator n=1 Tax=unclassified Siminovitchia TaxID=2837530 RepID=UPI0030CC30C0